MKNLDIVIMAALSEIPVPRAFRSSDLGGLVQVRMSMCPASPGACPEEQTSLMLEEQLLAFITAALELHFEPGVNPHTGGKTRSVWKIAIAKLGEPRSAWHTTPGLRAGARGAAVLHWNEAYIATVWRHPDCIREEEAHMVNTDRDPELKQLPICGTCRGIKHGDEHTVVRADARCICPATDSVAADQAH
jgi:hypothetical protein